MVPSFVLALAAGLAVSVSAGRVAVASSSFSGLVIDTPRASSAGTAHGNCTTTFPVLPRLAICPTWTVWTSTTTSTIDIDCGGCDDYALSTFFPGVPPVAFFTTTVTAQSPFTTSALRCAGASHEAHSRPQLYQVPPGLEEPTLVTPLAAAKPECTSTTHVGPPIPDATHTVYSSTVTSTSTVACGSCALLWSTAAIKLFAPIRITATVSPATPSTKIELACSTTDPADFSS